MQSLQFIRSWGWFSTLWIPNILFLSSSTVFLGFETIHCRFSTISAILVSLICTSLYWLFFALIRFTTGLYHSNSNQAFVQTQILLFRPDLNIASLESTSQTMIASPDPDACEILCMQSQSIMCGGEFPKVIQSHCCFEALFYLYQYGSCRM